MKKNGKCKENNDETEIIEANMTKSKPHEPTMYFTLLKLESNA
jgi:hypothetical protein